MEYISTAIICIILAAAVFLIIQSMRKEKKAGGSATCSCGCSDCAMKGICHENKKQ